MASSNDAHDKYGTDGTKYLAVPELTHEVILGQEFHLTVSEQGREKLVSMVMWCERAFGPRGGCWELALGSKQVVMCDLSMFFHDFDDAELFKMAWF